MSDHATSADEPIPPSRPVRRPTEAIDTDFEVRDEKTVLGRPAPAQPEPPGPPRYGANGEPEAASPGLRSRNAADLLRANAAREKRREAIALSYDQNGQGAPRVVAKGYGLIAETIIARARAEGLYVHQAPEMVSMLMHVGLDREIPPALYQAVAELMAWLYRLESGSGGTSSTNPAQ